MARVFWDDLEIIKCKILLGISCESECFSVESFISDILQLNRMIFTIILFIFALEYILQFLLNH